MRPRPATWSNPGLLPGLLLLGLLLAPQPSPGGLSFDGTSQYVTFGPSPSLGAPAFTVETWFNWDGHGRAASTGSGGVRAIPLIAKLRSENDNSTRDGNYLLGIAVDSGTLVGDLEEGAEGRRPGRNHPVPGTVPIASNVWHHAALTYDGTHFLIYLDGRLDGAVTVGQPPRFDSAQHTALATTLNTEGKPEGFFAGTLDEVRIWSYARTASEINDSLDQRILSAPGLLGCWALDQTGGHLAPDSSGAGVTGELINGPVWRNDYRATGDITAPIPFTAVDPVATETLRQVEARRIPPFFRYDPTLVTQQLDQFDKIHLLTRERFLATLHETFPIPSVEETWERSAEFGRLVDDFEKENDGFPVTTNLARVWIEGIDSFQPKLAEQLRELLRGPIRPSGLPPEAGSDQNQVHLIHSPLNTPIPSLQVAERTASLVPATQVRSIQTVTRELRELYPEPSPLRTHLERFLKPNCIFEPGLTRQSRNNQTAQLFSVLRYEAGQPVVQKGQIINSRRAQALKEMETGLVADTVNAREEVDLIKAQTAATVKTLEDQARESEFQSRLFLERNQWLIMALGGVMLLSLFTVWRLTRLKRLRTFLPELPPAQWQGAGAVPTLPTTQVILSDARPSPDQQELDEWKARARSAEERAARTSEVIRQGLLPQVGQWLKHKMFRKAVEDRARLMETQQRAEFEVSELEKRLEKLQAPLHARLRAYEARIVELETELNAKGEESRELIRAKIELTRTRLAAARNIHNG